MLFETILRQVYDTKLHLHQQFHAFLRFSSSFPESETKFASCFITRETQITCRAAMDKMVDLELSFHSALAVDYSLQTTHAI
jgi:hypothetical protein